MLSTMVLTVGAQGQLELSNTRYELVNKFQEQIIHKFKTSETQQIRTLNVLSYNKYIN